MQVSEPIQQTWRAHLRLDFGHEHGRTSVRKQFDGPLVVQKPLYPEGGAVCHAIVVHPPGGIVGGDELCVTASADRGSHALLTTPGAGKWYRSAGAWARQTLDFRVAGVLEWLPRETIVFNGARADLAARIDLSGEARYIGWEILCLGRTGSGETFRRGEVRLRTDVMRDGRRLWTERARIPGGGALLDSPAGLAGHTVVGTLVASAEGSFAREMLARCRDVAPTTALPGVLVARYLGDSSEEAMTIFTRLWAVLRPHVAGREAVAPRIWST